MKYDNFTDALGQLGKLLKEAKKPSVLKRIGQKCIELIYNRTKLGYGVSNDKGGNAKKVKLPGHSDSYIDYRETYDHLLHDTTTPTKSNLTFTGQLLDALKFKIAGDGITIYIEDSGRKKGKITNKKLDIRNFLG